MPVNGKIVLAVLFGYLILPKLLLPIYSLPVFKKDS